MSDNIVQSQQDASSQQQQPQEVQQQEVSQPQSQQPQSQQQRPQPPVQRPPEFYNLADVTQAIARYYERDFPKLAFNAPSQIVDGAVVEFVDIPMNVVVATARVRIRNRVIINHETGDLFMRIDLSDLSFGKSTMQLSAMK